MIWRFLEGGIEGFGRIVLGAILFLPLLFCFGLTLVGWMLDDGVVLMAAVGCTLIIVLVGGTVAGWMRFQ
jgi:hypothetical protein